MTHKLSGGKLNEKQRMFVQEYLVDLCASAAARRAGYSERTARNQTHRLLSDPKIQAAIREAQAARVERLHVSQDAVIRELALIGFSNMGEYSSWDDLGVRLIASDGLTVDQKAAIAEITETNTSSGRNVKIKLNDKIRALELLGKHLGMFSDRVEHSGTVGVTIVDDIPRNTTDE